MTLTVDDRELIEEVAKAIFDAFCSGVHSPMAREQYARQQRYKEAARAVLQTPRLQSLLSERDKLREALRPFADHAEAFGGGHVEADMDGHSLMACDFTIARAALIQTEVP